MNHRFRGSHAISGNRLDSPNSLHRSWLVESSRL